MDLDAIRELIALMKANQIEEIDWTSGEVHIRLKAAQPPAPVIVPPAYAPYPAAVPAAPPAGLPPAAPLPGAASAPAAGAAPPGAAPEAEPAGIVIKSPIVGVFYAAPAPDKPPFVEIGQSIDENTVIGIIEAMKVMNEIKAEVKGVVRAILVENGQSVEFGQPLMVIDPVEA